MWSVNSTSVTDTPLPQRWQTRPGAELSRRSGPVITWSFASGSGTSTSPISGSVQSQYQAVIERAIQTWAAATGLTFTQVPASAASDIQIGWGDFDTTSSGTVGYTSS